MAAGVLLKPYNVRPRIKVLQIKGMGGNEGWGTLTKISTKNLDLGVKSSYYTVVDYMTSFSRLLLTALAWKVSASTDPRNA